MSDGLEAVLAGHDDPLFSSVNDREWTWLCPCGVTGRAIGPNPTVGAERHHRAHLADAIRVAGWRKAGDGAEESEVAAQSDSGSRVDPSATDRVNEAVKASWRNPAAPVSWTYEPCAREHTPGRVCILPDEHGTTEAATEGTTE